MPVSKHISTDTFSTVGYCRILFEIPTWLSDTQNAMSDKPRGMCEKEEERQKEQMWGCRNDGTRFAYRSLSSLTVSKYIVLVLMFC